MAVVDGDIGIGCTRKEDLQKRIISRRPPNSRIASSIRIIAGPVRLASNPARRFLRSGCESRRTRTGGPLMAAHSRRRRSRRAGSLRPRRGAVPLIHLSRIVQVRVDVGSDGLGGFSDTTTGTTTTGSVDGGETLLLIVVRRAALDGDQGGGEEEVTAAGGGAGAGPKNGAVGNAGEGRGRHRDGVCYCY